MTKLNGVDRRIRASRAFLPVLALLLIAGFGYWGHQHHFFGSAATVAQRFPGDPNPLQSGKTYWGANTEQSGAGTMTYESAAGKSLDIHRVFGTNWSSIQPGGKLMTDLKNDRAHNRFTWLSMKPPCEGWQALANGKYDGGTSGLDQFLKALDADGRPVWLTLSHEPENDVGTPKGANCKGVDDATGPFGTAANWRAAQSHVRARMTALGIKHVAFAPILMAFTFQSAQRDPNDWWVSGIWDFWGQDVYQASTSASGMWNSPWPKVLTWAKSKGLAIGIGEWGIDSAQPDASEASEMQEFIDRNFADKNDIIAYSYYDRSNWLMSGAKLTKFENILKSDTRLIHMSDLGSVVTPPTNPPPGDTTPPTVSFTAPAANATVSGLINVTASASDNVGVTKVSMFVDTNIIKNDTVSSDGWTSQWGSTTVSNGTHTLKLTAYDAAGNTSTVTRTITVNNPTTAPPSVTSFVASPATITTGQSTTFNWATVNTVSCNITPSGPTNTTTTSWTTLAQSTTGTKTYTLTCRNSAGATASKATSFTVNAAPTPPTGVTLNASATTVKSGTNVVFSWSSAGSTSCTLNPGGYRASGVSSSKTLTMTSTTTFTVYCGNAAGSTASNKVTVTVTSAPVPLPAPSITSFVATPSSVAANGTSILTWQTSNVAANGCSLAPSPLSTTSASGSWTTPPLSSSASYTLTCKNSANAITSKSVSVAVANTPIPAPPAPANPGTIQSTTSSSSSNAGARVVKATTGEKVVDARATPTVKSTDKITLDASTVTDQKVVDSILKVEFYDGEKLIKTVMTAPFVLDPATLPHGTLSPGSHSLTQRTYYKDGSMSEQSQLVTIKATPTALVTHDSALTRVLTGVAAGLVLLSAGTWYFVFRTRGFPKGWRRLLRVGPWRNSSAATAKIKLDARPEEFFFKSATPGSVVEPANPAVTPPQQVTQAVNETKPLDTVPVPGDKQT